MRIVFGVYGYSEASEPLQPWLTVREVASCLVQAGHDVHVITDIDEGTSLDGLQMHCVRTLRPSNAAEVSSLLTSLSPDKVVVLSTPMNLSGKSWYKDVTCNLYAFLSYPFYTRAELLRALPHLERHDMITYGKHALVPRSIWAGTLRRYFRGVIGQSQRTVERVANAAGGAVERHVIRAGTDADFWSPAQSVLADSKKCLRFLFVGSPKAIRGFHLLVEAFGRLDKDNVELRILARGANDDDMGVINNLLDRYCRGNRMRISVEGGWVDRAALRDEIRMADIVVLPFVLVPSELPVSILESIACGTPVISTDIDGLPEAAGKAGIIVRPGSVPALLDAMNEIAATPGIMSGMRQQCQYERGHMQSWGAMSAAWQQLLTG